MTMTYQNMAKTLSYVRDKFGLLASMLMHVGINLSMVLVLLDIIYCKTHHEVVIGK